MLRSIYNVVFSSSELSNSDFCTPELFVPPFWRLKNMRDIPGRGDAGALLDDEQSEPVRTFLMWDDPPSRRAETAPCSLLVERMLWSVSLIRFDALSCVPYTRKDRIPMLAA